MKTCKNCKFAGDEKADEIVCVRFPPSVFPMQRMNPLTRQPDLGFISIFPNCPAESTACGEWIQRTDKTDTKIVRPLV